MSLPVVAVVGRPNVGKSTLVNRISQNKDAIVHEMRGVTRDRAYHEADWNGVAFTLVDTGGIEVGGDDDFQASITNQAFTATHEADVIVLLADGRTGINTDDEEVARILRRSNKLADYIIALVKVFHSYYNSSKVYNPDDPDLTNQRLGLVTATKITLKNALELIGVSAPESM